MIVEIMGGGRAVIGVLDADRRPLWLLQSILALPPHRNNISLGYHDTRHHV